MSDLTIVADHVELRQLRPWLDDQAAHLDSDLLGRIELCVHELATNVIDHSGATELSMRFDAQPSKLAIELRDSGAPMEPSNPLELEPHPRVRGYGLMIAERLASQLSYERLRKVNVWRATFDLAV